MSGDLDRTQPGSGTILWLLLGAGAFLVGRRHKVHVLPPGMHLPVTVGDLQASLGEARALPPTGAVAHGMSPQQARQQALDVLRANPERAVHILRAWINDNENDSAGGRALERRALEPHRT